jgi:Rieske 2Fe-2S family protein
MDVRRDVLERLQNRRPGFSLPQAFYTDPEIYRLDLDTIFYRDWLFVGHDCEIAKPGNFLTAQVGSYPVIVLRGADGLVRAFHN